MKRPLMAIAALSLLAGCQPQTKYDWAGYPNALLAYYHSPTDRSVFDKSLDDAINTGAVKHRVPPGIYAEAGYEAFSHGDNQKAIDLFNKEKAAWPESTTFMDKAIANVGKPSQPTADNGQHKGAAQ